MQRLSGFVRSDSGTSRLHADTQAQPRIVSGPSVSPRLLAPAPNPVAHPCRLLLADQAGVEQVRPSPLPVVALDSPPAGDQALAALQQVGLGREPADRPVGHAVHVGAIHRGGDDVAVEAGQPGDVVLLGPREARPRVGPVDAQEAAVPAAGRTSAASCRSTRAGWRSRPSRSPGRDSAGALRTRRVPRFSWFRLSAGTRLGHRPRMRADLRRGGS